MDTKYFMPQVFVLPSQQQPESDGSFDELLKELMGPGPENQPPVLTETTDQPLLMQLQTVVTYNETNHGFEQATPPPPTIPKVDDVMAPANSTQEPHSQGFHLNYWPLKSQLSPISSDEAPPALESAPSKPSSSSSTSSRSTTAGPLPINLDDSVAYMKECLDRYENIVKANGSNGKLQVHQIVLFLLLATVDSRVQLNLDNVLVFCDQNGKHPSKKGREYFKAQNTKVMGLIWQKIKGNKNCNFDTFARAMRVGRERREREYFDYLVTGKGSKKRIYKLGSKSIEEMKQMENLLPTICCLKDKKL